jgi:hypothetical protein
MGRLLSNRAAIPGTRRPGFLAVGGNGGDGGNGNFTKRKEKRRFP